METWKTDFLRNPNGLPADHNLQNLEFNVIPGDDFYAVEFAFDLDIPTAFISLDEPDEKGITWLRAIVSIQGSGAPLIVWPDGDFNGNVNYVTHESSGWDHMGWWDVTSERNTPLRFEASAGGPAELSIARNGGDLVITYGGGSRLEPVVNPAQWLGNVLPSAVKRQ